MKTVQEWLGGLDRNRLLDLYASRYPLHAEDTISRGRCCTIISQVSPARGGYKWKQELSGACGGAAGSADPGHR